METTDTLPIITRNSRLILIAGCVALLIGTASVYFSSQNNPPTPQVDTRAELTLDEAKKKVWFSLPELDVSQTTLAFRNAHVVGDDWVVLHYEQEATRWVDIGKGVKRPARGKHPLPKDARKTTLVNGHLAIFIAGDFDDNGDWKADSDYKTLEWSASGFNYRLEQRGLQWDYKAMVQLAEALIIKPTSNSKPVS